MAMNTPIQWTDSTINPTMGCDGCELWNKDQKICYAGTLHNRYGGKSKGYAPTFEEVTEFPGRMTKATRWRDLSNMQRPGKPWLDGLPRHVFVSDMGDALSKKVTFEYLRCEIIDAVTSEKGQRHQWQWLTKEPVRMAQFSRWLDKRGIDWPVNLWAGTSITTQKTTGRIDRLLKVGNSQTIHFLSVEPQWEDVDLRPWLRKLDWIIQGGQSGQEPRPFHIEWVASLRGQCREFGVPLFVKQLGANVLKNGKRLRLSDGHGGDWDEWPKRLRVREMPDIANN